jgi:hypothetical protein
MDINHAANLLYIACDDGALVEVDARSGKTRNNGRWRAGRMQRSSTPPAALCMSRLASRASFNRSIRAQAPRARLRPQAEQGRPRSSHRIGCTCCPRHTAEFLN